MMRRTLFTIILLVLFKYAGAQEQLSLKQQADKSYDRYEYYKSLNLYLAIAKPDVHTSECIAQCYFNINDYQNAEDWYARIVAEPKASIINHYYYAKVLLRNKKFEEAKVQYKLFYKTDISVLALKLSDCDSAALWIKQRSMYKVQSTANVNSSTSDWGLTYYGKTGLVFTSDRSSDDGTDNRTGNDWFKLFETDAKTDGTKLFELASKATGESYNGKYHFGPIAFNKTADTAYITQTTGTATRQITLDNPANAKLYTRRMQLIVAKKSNGKWVYDKDFAYNNINKYSVSSATLSPDGKVLYFVSDMPGGRGKTDIWYCERGPEGNWGKPVNCGPNINTKQEENFPYLDDSGTFYFASKGLPGMGGYDIYSAKGQKANWTLPQNLKYPINSTSDDFYMVTRDGKNGYLSSNREGGKGSDDIYSFAPDPAYIKTSKPMARIAIPATPKTIPPNTTGQGFAFDPIYYDLDKSNIRPDAAIELDKLVGFLKQYPQLTIEVSSYTDSRANEDYNMALSHRRAQSAVDYLVAKGVDQTRLIAKWCGKNKLVNNCPDGVKCSEAEHQSNRRTEFSVAVSGKMK